MYFKELETLVSGDNYNIICFCGFFLFSPIKIIIMTRVDQHCVLDNIDLNSRRYIPADKQRWIFTSEDNLCCLHSTSINFDMNDFTRSE